ncbi:MAG: hypothetical protein LBU73_06660 [Helicobacteraceae bacterium]|jgi:hypothetical protein|nr:hypothetical protein [Helicobacteraceae bacterium]
MDETKSKKIKARVSKRLRDQVAKSAAENGESPAAYAERLLNKTRLVSGNQIAKTLIAAGNEAVPLCQKFYALSEKINQIAVRANRGDTSRETFEEYKKTMEEIVPLARKINEIQGKTLAMCEEIIK